MVIAMCAGCDSKASSRTGEAPESASGSAEQAATYQVPEAPYEPIRATGSVVANFDDANAIVVDYKELGTGLTLDDKYPTQTIEITGTIAGVDAISATTTSVTFHGADFTPLLCALQVPQAWARLAPGQTVTLHGTRGSIPGTLYSFVWKVMKADANPCPVLTSEKWTAEFELDPEAAHQKYNNKWFYLTGKVAGIANQEADNSTITMEGASGWTVELGINHSYREIVNAIKTGERTTALCKYESYDFQPSTRKLTMMGAPITVEFPVPGVSYGVMTAASTTE